MRFIFSNLQLHSIRKGEYFDQLLFDSVSITVNLCLLHESRKSVREIKKNVSLKFDSVSVIFSCSQDLI